MIFVAQVNVDAAHADRPRGDDHAFEETVRIALEVGAILEGARLPFVDVDGHHFRARLGTHNAPFAPGRETRTAEPAQARMLHFGDQRLGVVAAGKTARRKRIPARLAVGSVAGVAGCDVKHHARALARIDHQRRVKQGLVLRLGVAHIFFAHQPRDLFASGTRHCVLADCCSRGLLATADARGWNHSYILAEQGWQAFEQILGAGHLARQRVANPYRDRRRRLAAGLDDVEVVVKGRYLVDLGHRQPHLARQRHQMPVGEVAEPILQLVQVFDQQVATARRIAQQFAHFGDRLLVGLAPFGLGFESNLVFDCLQGNQV